MVLQYSFPLITTFILFLSLIWLYLKVCKRSKVQKLPPGPWKLPLIGNLHNLVGSLPHHSLQELARKHGALMQLQLGEISAVVVSSPRMAREFMKTHDLAFADRPEFLVPKIMFYGGSDIAFSPYGDYWRQMRKVCVLELLSAKRVQSFSCLREEEVHNLIESIHSSSGTSIDFSEHIISLTGSIVSRVAFGGKCRDQDEFQSLTKEFSSLSGGFELADLFPSQKFVHVISGVKAKLEKIHGKIDKILENIIDEHRENQMSASAKQEDLVDVLVGLQQSGTLEFPITTNNIKAIILKVSTTTEVEIPSEAKTTQEIFSKGTLVEVGSDEDGFHGAWFTGTIVEEPVRKDKFLVQYQSLRADDDSGFLREEIDTLHIRPYPPETLVVDRFNLFEEVDAWYNDGWWVGVISKVLVGTKYRIYFRDSNEEMEFQHSNLRPHQDWIDGKWVMASRALEL